MPDRPPDLLDIGELAARTGVAPSALRYYEREGLLRSWERVGDERRDMLMYAKTRAERRA